MKSTSKISGIAKAVIRGQTSHIAALGTVTKQKIVARTSNAAADERGLAPLCIDVALTARDTQILLQFSPAVLDPPHGIMRF